MPITIGTRLGPFEMVAPLGAAGISGPADGSGIWALGRVLDEMVTGTRAFAGASQASLIGAISPSQRADPAENARGGVLADAAPRHEVVPRAS
jgi:hypothetical protein